MKTPPFNCKIGGIFVLYKYMKWVHVLRNINIEKKTAVCKNCGVVSLIKRNRKGRIKWSCFESEKYYKIKTKYSFEIPDKIVSFGKCPLCLKEKKLCIDHCHDKNIFRGFICKQCNTVLGLSYDNKDTLMRMVKYLTQKYHRP